ncbi:hypothetical protein [Bdellovibrio bacteriovorus]|uniref:hypothetical protein n=1 Tax=Bdellovibrio bacteriovorus TaxID=959 RepID=UPI0035A62402
MRSALALGFALVFTSSSLFAEEVKTEKYLSKDEQIEIDEISDICDALKKAYDSKKAMDHEKKIGKVSGAVNMTKLNQAGRDGIEATSEADRLLTNYKNKYNEFPDLDNRCRFFVEMSPNEKKQLLGTGKKTRSKSP